MRTVPDIPNQSFFDLRDLDITALDRPDLPGGAVLAHVVYHPFRGYAELVEFVTRPVTALLLHVRFPLVAGDINKLHILHRFLAVMLVRVQ